MIFVLKLLLFMFGFLSGIILFYIYKQHNNFLKSDESNGLSLLNKFLIRIIAWILYLFFLSTISLCVYFILSKIIIEK
jgi:hypothetical protein